MFDVIIIGGGPAGLSAAVNARQRGLTAVAVSNDSANSGLYKAREVSNYPGYPMISGAQLLKKLEEHAIEMGAELVTGKVAAVMSAGGVFNVGYDTEIIRSKALIVAIGVSQTSLFPGETKLLGKGLSYCATCDGMLYRGKRVCVVCLAPGAAEEADFLASIGCEVVRVDTKDIIINGESQVTSVMADGEEIKCDGVFILRQSIAPNLLLPKLEMESGHIKTGFMGETNIRGVFAAGDCAGAPYQIAKAVGEGQKAALSASEYIASVHK